MNELNANLQKYGDGYKLLKSKFYEKRHYLLLFYLI